MYFYIQVIINVEIFCYHLIKYPTNKHPSMTENKSNSDLIAISKSCIQINNKIQQLIASEVGSAHTQQIPVNLKKSKDVSFYEFLAKAMQNLPVPKVFNQSQRYCLQQDLQIILLLSDYNEVTDDIIHQITQKRKIHRSFKMLRMRAKYLVGMIGEKQVQQIVKWIQTNGVKGYLTFQYKRLKLYLNDPTDKIKIFEEHDNLKRGRSTSLDNNQKEQEPKKNKQRLSNICPELNEIFTTYSRVNNVSNFQLLQYLHQNSGDFVLVDKYVETRNQNMLWSKEEDESLKNDEYPLTTSYKYRTSEQIAKRRKYLGI